MPLREQVSRLPSEIYSLLEYVRSRCSPCSALAAQSCSASRLGTRRHSPDCGKGHLPAGSALGSEAACEAHTHQAGCIDFEPTQVLPLAGCFLVLACFLFPDGEPVLGRFCGLQIPTECRRLLCSAITEKGPMKSRLLFSQ